jgi:hypothetical protein
MALATLRALMITYGQVGTNPLTGKLWSTADIELDHWPQPRRSTGAEPNWD